MATPTTFDPTNPLAQIQSMMKGEIDEAQTRHDSALGQLKSTLGAPQEEGNEAGRWGAIASGFSDPASNFGQALANAGGAYGRELQKQFQAQQLGKQRSAELEFQDAAKRLQGLEGKYASALTGRANQNPWQVVKIGEGQWVRVNKFTNDQVPLTSNDAALYQTKFKEGLKTATELGHGDPLSYAESYANSFVANKPPALAAGPTTFQPTPTGGVVPTKPFAGAEVAPTVDRSAMDKQLSVDEQAAVAAGDYTKALELQKARAAMQSAPTASGRPVLVDNRQAVGEKHKYGEKIGAHMADTSIDLQKTGAAASSLIGDLSVMEQLYSQHGDNVPEGALGPALANMKSGLKSLGVEVSGTGPTDILSAMATKQALKSRTADGENLLPGAMSNYEDRLLQSMSPGLSMTKEGRMLMIQMMKAQLQMKTDLADAARKYVAANGRLDEKWFTTAAELAKKNPYLDPRRLAAMESYSKDLLKGVK